METQRQPKRRSGWQQDQAQDRSAWVTDVYQTYKNSVFRTCQRFAAGDRQWALDRTHDVFMHLVENAETVREREEPGGWLYRTAVNLCISALRRKRTAWRFLPFLRASARESVSPVEGQVRAQRTLVAFDEALQHLPAAERAVLALVYLDNKSQTEAARLLGVSKGQVSKLHTKALTTLRAQDWDIDDA